MTAQAPDQFFYRDQKLDLVGIKGNELPIPATFGIETRMASTACYRGYIMRYKITDDRLVLDGFWCHPTGANLPEINGAKPSNVREDNISMSHFFKYEYKNLNQTIAFTGSLWLARDFIDSQYVHMGFQSPTAYRIVLKFVFQDGIIVNIENKSEAVGKAREKGDCKGANPESMSPEDLEEWIMKRFSLDIDYYKKKENDE